MDGSDCGSSLAAVDSIGAADEGAGSSANGLPVPSTALPCSFAPAFNASAAVAPDLPPVSMHLPTVVETSADTSPELSLERHDEVNGSELRFLGSLPGSGSLLSPPAPGSLIASLSHSGPTGEPPATSPVPGLLLGSRLGEPIAPGGNGPLLAGTVPGDGLLSSSSRGESIGASALAGLQLNSWIGDGGVPAPLSSSPLASSTLGGISGKSLLEIGSHSAGIQIDGSRQVPLASNRFGVGVSTGNLALAPSDNGRKNEWEVQMESADARQAELFRFQWNLVREQMGTFARELSGLQQRIDGLQTVASRCDQRTGEVLRQVQIVQGEIEREAATRQREDEALVNSVGQYTRSIDQALDGRTARTEEVARLAKQAFEAVDREREERGRVLQELDEQSQQALRSLQGNAAAERTERMQQIAELEGQVRAAKLLAEQGVQDRQAFREEISQISRHGTEALEHERQDRGNACAALAERAASVQRELATEQEQRTAALERLDRRFEESRNLAVQERQSLEQQFASFADVAAGLEARAAEHRGVVESRLCTERSAREEQAARMAEAANVQDRELRRLVDRCSEEAVAGHGRLRELLADRGEAADRELRVDLSRVAAEAQAECTRLRSECVGLAEQVQSTEQALRREVSRVAEEVQSSGMMLKSESSNLAGQLEVIEKELRREVARVLTEQDSIQERLRSSQESLRSTLETLEQKFKDTCAQLSSKQQASESTARATIESMESIFQAESARTKDTYEQLDSSLRALVTRVSLEFSSSVSQNKSNAEQRFALLDQSLDDEKHAREACADQLQQFQSQVKDDLAQQVVEQDARRQEIQSAVEFLQKNFDEGIRCLRNDYEPSRVQMQTSVDSFRQLLDMEKAERMDHQAAVTVRIATLEEASAAGLEDCESCRGRVEELAGRQESLLSKVDFDRECQRLWEAVDTHTHEVTRPGRNPQIPVAHGPAVGGSASVASLGSLAGPAPVAQSVPVGGPAHGHPAHSPSPRVAVARLGSSRSAMELPRPMSPVAVASSGSYQLPRPMPGVTPCISPSAPPPSLRSGRGQASSHSFTGV